jgi:hypothetical protein
MACRVAAKCRFVTMGVFFYTAFGDMARIIDRTGVSSTYWF